MSRCSCLLPQPVCLHDSLSSTWQTQGSVLSQAEALLPLVPLPPAGSILTTPRAGSGHSWACTHTVEKHHRHHGQEDEVPMELACPSLQPWGGKGAASSGPLGSLPPLGGPGELWPGNAELQDQDPEDESHATDARYQVDRRKSLVCAW